MWIFFSKYFTNDFGHELVDGWLIIEYGHNFDKFDWQNDEVPSI